jgi:DNA-damage-inducible protein J
MPANTSMLHIRIDDQLKKSAIISLANVGMTVSEAIRILLTRVVEEGGLPPGLTTTPKQYDVWFKAKVEESLNDPRSDIPFDVVMEKLRTKLKK